MAALAIVLSAACGSIHAADAPDRWRLSDLFPSITAWQAEAQQLEARAGDLAACRGHLGDSARRWPTASTSTPCSPNGWSG